MYDYGYNYGYNTYEVTKAASNFAGAGIWLFVAAILALIGGIVAYYLFVKPDKDQSNKFLAWLKDFLNFKTMLIEGLLKVFYVIAAIFTTLASFACFALGGLGVLLFFVVLIFGNIVVRICYEGMLLKIMIWKNTTEINKKM